MIQTTTCTTWAAAVSTARMRAAAERRTMHVIVRNVDFAVMPTNRLRPVLADRMAATIEPDLDLAAMLDACPAKADAVAAFTDALVAARGRS